MGKAIKVLAVAVAAGFVAGVLLRMIWTAWTAQPVVWRVVILGKDETGRAVTAVLTATEKQCRELVEAASRSNGKPMRFHGNRELAGLDIRPLCVGCTFERGDHKQVVTTHCSPPREEGGA